MTRHTVPKNDYVILVSPADPRSYLTGEHDECDGESAISPDRTTDVEMALRFSDFAQCRTALRKAITRWPTHEFRIDVTTPRIDAPQELTGALDQSGSMH